MKRSLLLLVLGLGLGLGPACSRPGSHKNLQWFTDVNAAKDAARKENKFILLDFTGSDWCGWCIRLEDEVFSQPEFTRFAKEKLILVEVDFPRRKSLDPRQLVANAQLASMYHIEGFPTIIVLDPNGQKAGETGYMPGGPEVFNAQLEQIMRAGVRTTQAPPSPPPAVAAPKVTTPPVTTPTGVSNYYGALKLKGISGDKDHRLVLINNATLMVGETAIVKVQSRKVEVVCKEIRDSSVLITVEGNTTELRLGTP